MAVATSTSAATETSIVAERLIDCAAPSVPSVGRCRRQFHAPSANTIATRHNFTTSAIPYGDNHRLDSTCRWLHAMITPNNTNTGVALKASGELVVPIAFTVPLQLLPYHIAVLKGTDVDQPRNLAKSVTVE